MATIPYCGRVTIPLWISLNFIGLFHLWISLNSRNYCLFKAWSLSKICLDRRVRVMDRSPVIRQNGKSQNGYFKKTEHGKFPVKRAFLTSETGVRNFCFGENLTCYIFLKNPFWDSSFCFISDEITRFQFKVASHIGTIQFICRAIQMIAF